MTRGVAVRTFAILDSGSATEGGSCLQLLLAMEANCKRLAGNTNSVRQIEARLKPRYIMLAFKCLPHALRTPKYNGPLVNITDL